MGLPLRAPNSRPERIFLQVPGALPAKQRRGAMPSWAAGVSAGAGLARVWASEFLRNLLCVRAPALAQRALWAQEPVRLLVRLALVC